MGNIPQTLSNHRQIPRRNPTSTENNPGVIIRRLSATKPVWKNEDTYTPPQNYQVRHIGCICVLPDAPSERPDPRVLRSNIFNPTETTQGLQTLDPPTKYQKAIPAKLVLHIYKRTDTHLNTSIGQLIAGTFFFGMQSCEYSTTPKGEDKRTRILHKGDIHFYMKRREVSHESGILHLADKVSPTFRTQKNGVKNATMTQWRTTTTICPVNIWAEIIIRLDSYSGTTSVTPVNTVWVECHKRRSPHR